jgi:hypothetical protein
MKAKQFMGTTAASIKYFPEMALYIQYSELEIVNMQRHSVLEVISFVEFAGIVRETGA